MRWCLYKLLKWIHDKTFQNFTHKRLCVFHHHVLWILQNTLWQSFDFRDRTKAFDYKALSICVFSFYCHCAVGLHKTLDTKYAMTLKRNIYTKVAKRCKIQDHNFGNHIWWQRRFWSHTLNTHFDIDRQLLTTFQIVNSVFTFINDTVYQYDFN